MLRFLHEASFLLLACGITAYSVAMYSQNAAIESSCSASTSCDFGLVKAGSKLKGNFLFVNKLPEVIEIERVTPSCEACSRASLLCESDNCSLLEPGGEVAIEVIWDTTGETGFVFREFYVFWHKANMNSMEKTTLKVEATVSP